MDFVKDPKDYLAVDFKEATNSPIKILDGMIEVE
jgi:hypothetical protein